MKNNNNGQEAGSVFFYILLAIALFAALSYAVSRGNRGNTSMMTDQQAKLAAQEIIEYGQTVANAVQKLKLRGYADHQLDVSNDVFLLQNGNPISTSNNACSEEGCRLFNINGGGIVAKNAPEIAHGNVPITGGGISSPGQGNFRAIIINNVGSSEPDLVFAHTNINQETCLQINTLLGIENPSNLPPVEDYHVGNYTGDLTSFPPPSLGTDPIGDEVTTLAGQSAFCVTNGSDPYYSYYQVVIVR
jgi:hypothetical protein